MSDISEIISFWFKDLEPKQWYEVDPELDAQIKTRFGALQQSAAQGALDHWQQSSEGALALLILLDQFSRNLFRGSSQSFDADPKARDIARAAIANDYDLNCPDQAQQFFYLPFMHSEEIADQDYGVELFETRARSKDSLHARAHREIIASFGRFPFRNQALGRDTTPAEQTFLDEGGYGAIVRKLENKTES